MLKNCNFNEKIRSLPVAFAALALGLGGLGNAWTIIIQEGFSDWNNASINLDLITHTVQIICFILCIFFISIVIYRQIVNYKDFWREMHHPVAASVMATIPMSLFLISGFISQMGIAGTTNLIVANGLTIFASIIFYLALIMHICLLIIFTWKIICKHDFRSDSVYASWFVPPVGIVVACLVSRFFPAEIVPSMLFIIIWCFGFGMLLILLPYIVYKITFANNVADDKLATLAIIGAPANLCLSGFLSVSEFATWGSTYWVLIVVQVILAIPTTFYLYIFLVKIFKTKFNPTFASLTFPTAVGTTAMLLLSSALANVNSELGLVLSHVANIFAYIFISVSTCVIAYVLARFAIIFYKTARDEPLIVVKQK